MAQAGTGTTIGIETAESTYTDIGEVLDISLDGQQNSTIDTTDLSSTGKTFIGGLPDYGSVTLNYKRAASDAGQTAVKSAFASADITGFKITFPKTTGQTSGDTMTFDALVTGWSLDGLSTDKVITYKVTLKISGAITETAGATE